MPRFYLEYYDDRADVPCRKPCGKIEGYASFEEAKQDAELCVDWLLYENVAIFILKVVGAANVGCDGEPVSVMIEG